MEWIKKHKVLTGIIAVVVLLVVVGAAGGSSSKNSSSSSPSTSVASSASASPSASNKLDLTAFYGQVQNGMTKDQVVGLAQKDPGNCTESETQGLGKYEVCTWYGNLGESSFVTVQFTNGTVSTKTKTGF